MSDDVGDEPERTIVYRHKEDTVIPRKNKTVVDKINRHNRLVGDDVEDKVNRHKINRHNRIGDDDLDAIIDLDRSIK